MAANTTTAPAGFDELRTAFPWPAAPVFPDAPPVSRRLGGFDLVEDAISKLGKANPVIMEIGAEFGTSTRRSLALPGAHVVSVDPWPDAYSYSGFPELAEHKGKHDHMYELFRSYTFAYRDRLVAVRAFSPAGPKIVYDAGVRPDLIYIDGDHGYDAVTRDILIASTLFSDAVIAGDDWRYNLKLRRLEGVPFPVQLAVKRWASTANVHVVTRGNQWLLDPSRPFNLDRPAPVYGLAQDEVAQRLRGLDEQLREVLRRQKRVQRSLAQLPGRRTLRRIRSLVKRGAER